MHLNSNKPTRHYVDTIYHSHTTASTYTYSHKSKRRNIVALAQYWSWNHTYLAFIFAFAFQSFFRLTWTFCCLHRKSCLPFATSLLCLYRVLVYMTVCACVAIGCCLDSIVYADCNDDTNDNKTGRGDRELPQNLHLLWIDAAVSNYVVVVFVVIASFFCGNVRIVAT